MRTYQTAVLYKDGKTAVIKSNSIIELKENTKDLKNDADDFMTFDMTTHPYKFIEWASSCQIAS